MPAVAEVQFKASNSQQVVSAFNSVGSAAQTSATKVQESSSALTSVGKGMKSSVSNIGLVTSAFANLTLSIVSTYRAYRDLGDAQIAVDKANLRVKKTQEAIKKTTAEIAAIQKQGNKGGLEDQRRKIDLTKLTNALTVAQKKYGKNSIQAADAALKLKEAQVAGAGSSEKLKAAQAKLKIQQEQLGVQQDTATEQQERFNDTQQNFYLSIIPTALSSIGLLTTAFKGIGGAITGGGGLGGIVKFFGPIGLGITLLYLAFKTNFLGIKDIVSGVIDWIKDRFGLWKKTIEEVFGFIQRGDWGGAFNKIKEAAAAFWEDLKKTVPFFGGVADIVDKIQHGNWKGAFLAIQVALVSVWNNIKKQVPILGKIEDIITLIKNGKWSEAFQKIADTAIEVFNNTLGKGIEWMFGKNWKAGLDAAIAKIQAEAAVNKRSVPVQLALDLNEAAKKQFGVDVIKWFTDHPITSKIPFFAGITMMVDDPGFRQSVVTGATLLVQKVGEGITAVAGLLDPYIARFLTTLFSVEAWSTTITESAAMITETGVAIVTAIGGAISTAAADPNLTAGAMGDAAAGMWQGIQDWFTTQMPETTAVLQAIAQGFQDSIGSTTKFFQDAGSSIWNALIEGIKAAVAPFDITGALRGVLDKLKTDASITIKPTMDTTDVKKGATEATKTVKSIPTSHQTKISTPGAKESGYAVNTLHGYINKLPAQKTVRINVVTTGNVGAIAGVHGGVRISQHGYQGTVHRPTAFIAGEGGRPEDVTVRPRGSVQRGGGSGGGFSGTINVYVDGVLRPARYDMGARK